MPDSLADPQVTVIIPTHADRSDFLLAAIGSVRAQTYTAWSIIVVDNGAAAATTETIRALNDPRIQVVRSVENRGPGGGRNLGIQAAQTPWIAFLDSDDLWKPDFLATVFDYIRQHPVVAMVSARCEWFRTEHNGDREHVQLSRGHKADLTVAERLLREGNFVSTSTVVARTDALRAVGGFDERLSRSEDTDLWVQLSIRYPCVHLPDVLAYYRLHDGTTQVREDRLSKLERRVYLCIKALRTAEQFNPALVPLVRRRLRNTWKKKARILTQRGMWRQAADARVHQWTVRRRDPRPLLYALYCRLRALSQPRERAVAPVQTQTSKAPQSPIK